MRPIFPTIAGLFAITILAIVLPLQAGSDSDTPVDKSGVYIYCIPGEGSKTFGLDIAIDHEVVVHLRKGVVFKTLLDPGTHDFSALGLTGKLYTFRLEPGKET